MRIVGRIDSPPEGQCSRCKKLFRRGQEIALTIGDYDVLGWHARRVRHYPECPTTEVARPKGLE